MDESLFESNKVKLIEAITTAMGPGSGPDHTDTTEEIQHTADQSPKVIIIMESRSTYCYCG